MLIFTGLFAMGFTSDTKKPVQAETFNPISVGLLPDTQGSGEMVSIYPMDAVLQKFQDLGVDIVIPVGDLVNQGAPHEFEDWSRTAGKYRDAGMEFLPLMGNHERSFAYTVQWIENMKDFIPTDAVHMQDAQYLNYYVVRENVLIIVLKYYHLSIAFQWIKGVVEEYRDRVDHIIIGSHDGLIGAKYGQTREMIVEGTKGNDLLMDQWDEIRAFFSKHDVIWVQGHERIVYPNTIPKTTRPVMVYNASYRTNECFADDGSRARLLDGTNNTFNRVDTTPRTLSWRPGFSRTLCLLLPQKAGMWKRPWQTPTCFSLMVPPEQTRIM